MSNSRLVYSVFVFLCFASSTVSSYLNTSLTAHKYKCSPQQSRALLLFKQSLSSINNSIDHPPYDFLCQDWLGFAGYYPITMIWNTNTDCCDWEGVTCDRSTGDVIGLDLSCGMLQGTIHPNTSLFDLPHLQRLNLAFNDFSGSQIPREIGRLSKTLTRLNISDCGFSGQVPTNIMLLPKLVSLDLSGNDNLRIQPHVFNSLLINSTHLEHLSLRGVNMSRVLLIDVINISSSLKKLDLSSCSLNGRLPSWLFTLPSLEYLYLSYNMFSGDVPFNSSALPPLKALSLHNNQLGGQIDEALILKFTNLTALSLSSNNFSSDWELDTLLSSLTNLEFLDLSYSGLSLTTTSKAVTHHANPNLWYVGLASCKMKEFPESLRSMRNLWSLDLSNNQIHGDIPIWVREIGGDNQGLEILDLSHNLITGLPQFQLYGLHDLHLQSNQIQGPFPPSICNMRHLSSLNLSNNSFGGVIPQCLGNITSYLSYLNLNSNQFQGLVPPSICNMSYLELLDLSNNSFGGVIPQCLGNITPSLLYLNLNSNQFQGPFPPSICNMSYLKLLDLSNNSFGGVIPQCLGNITPSLLYLNLNSNQFQGPFPPSICNMSNLESLDLSHNSFGGVIPQCFIGNFSSSLGVIDLGNNDFHGTIPEMFDDCEVLEGLILNGNRLQGELPTSLSRCHSLRVLDLGNNHLNGTFPNWLGNLSQLQVLNLKSNMFHGDIATSSIVDSPFPSLRVLDLSHNRFVGQLPANYFENFNAMKNVLRSSTIPEYLTMYDDKYYSIDVYVKGRELDFPQISVEYTIVCLSNNSFQGKIPDIIGSLNSLIVLDLSHNSLTGLIPQDLGNLSEIESLDLSWNQLTGEIPQSIAELTGLEFLNFSQNHLVGRIPAGKQFNTFEGNSFGGNLNLCGLPLPKKCNENQQEPHLDDDGDEEDNGFTWKVVMLGYGCGTLFGLVMGYLMLSTGRPKWFNAIVDEGERMILTTRKKRRYITYIGR